jgi:hypothetical protein
MSDLPTAETPARRWAQPALLAVALVLFLLPWIEIRCDGSMAMPNAPGGAAVAAGPGELVISRTGLQLATNDATVTQNGQPVPQQGGNRGENKPDASQPLAIAYGLVMLAGLIATAALARRELRDVASLTTGVLGLVLLAGIETQSFDKIKQPRPDANAAGAAAFPLALGAEVDSRVQVNRLPAYWLSYAACAGLAVLGLTGQPWRGRSRAEG